MTSVALIQRTHYGYIVPDSGVLVSVIVESDRERTAFRVLGNHGIRNRNCLIGEITWIVGASINAGIFQIGVIRMKRRQGTT